MAVQPIRAEKTDVNAVLDLALQACELAQRAAAYAADGLAGNVAELFEKVHRCEHDLDRLDRRVDEAVTAAVSSAGLEPAREMLASMKIVIDVERVGDLLSSVAGRGLAVRGRLEPDDVTALVQMASALEKMLGDVRESFARRELERALEVVRADAEIDRLRNLIFFRHIENRDGEALRESVQVLLMAQALERAGDHAKNAAEEVCHLISGHTMRHMRRTSARSDEQMFIEWLRQNGR